jgi:hypothetical protein
MNGCELPKAALILAKTVASSVKEDQEVPQFNTNINWKNSTEFSNVTSNAQLNILNSSEYKLQACQSSVKVWLLGVV